jgi:hypothetical protein
LVRSFTEAGAFKLENKGLCTSSIFSQIELKKEKEKRKKHLIEKGHAKLRATKIIGSIYPLIIS